MGTVQTKAFSRMFLLKLSFLFLTLFDVGTSRNWNLEIKFDQPTFLHAPNKGGSFRSLGSNPWNSIPLESKNSRSGNENDKAVKANVKIEPRFNNTGLKINRIIGGKEVRPKHSMPWQAGLVDSNDKTFLVCGATILCPKFLMTAAHCVCKEHRHDDVPCSYSPLTPMNVKNFKVVVGAHDLNAKEASRVFHDIKAYHIHPKWKPPALHDTAIIELKKAIRLKPQARAVYLPKPGDTFAGETLAISGWGDTVHSEVDGKASHKLLVTSVPAVPDSKCMEIMGPVDETVTESSMCAGDIKEMKTDACQGDSGGPLTWWDKATDRVKLVGVVSQGVKCATPGYPGLYAKVSYVLDWIQKVMGNCNEKTCKNDKAAKKCMLGLGLMSAQRHYT